MPERRVLPSKLAQQGGLAVTRGPAVGTFTACLCCTMDEEDWECDVFMEDDHVMAGFSFARGAPSPRACRATPSCPSESEASPPDFFDETSQKLEQAFFEDMAPERVLADECLNHCPDTELMPDFQDLQSQSKSKDQSQRQEGEGKVLHRTDSEVTLLMSGNPNEPTGCDGPITKPAAWWEDVIGEARDFVDTVVDPDFIDTVVMHALEQHGACVDEDADTLEEDADTLEGCHIEKAVADEVEDVMDGTASPVPKSVSMLGERSMGNEGMLGVISTGDADVLGITGDKDSQHASMDKDNFRTDAHQVIEDEKQVNGQQKRSNKSGSASTPLA